MTGLVVEACGPHCLVQDLGRPGWAHVGVTASGAADRASHRAANAAVGNPDEAATLEVLFGGLRLRAARDVVVACAGPDTFATRDGEWFDAAHATEVRTGQVVEFPRCGLRRYVAVLGGIAVASVLGSRATDPTTGIGPAPIRVGDVIPVGSPRRRRAASATRLRGGGTPLVLRATWGPRADWFTADARDRLGEEYEVAAASDRVGVRLSGPHLPWARSAELPSEALVRGAVQVPPSGQPIVFGPDHPVTGGYPVIAIVDDPDPLWQLLPGQTVRLDVRDAR